MSDSAHSSDTKNLAAILDSSQEEIITEWRVHAGKLLRALGLDVPTITDHLPELVAGITRDLSRCVDGSVPDVLTQDKPPLHGIQRFHDGLNVGEVVGEYNLLRVAFNTVAERHGLDISGEATRIINSRIDEAVVLAVTAFADYQASIRKDKEEEYLAFIAHDLRTPLNAVSLLVEELKYGLDQKALDDAGDLFEMIARNLQRAESHIKRALDTDVEPADGDTFYKPVLRNFELWPVVQRLILDLGAVSEAESITVVNSIPSTLTVCADAGLVSQVFQNLLSNAFKYAPHGRVTLQAENGTPMVTCKVADNGAGIPDHMLPHIFDKLVTDPDRKGTGFGLAIVKQIVEAHGGTAQAHSIHGEGAVFTFTLPTARED